MSEHAQTSPEELVAALRKLLAGDRGALNHLVARRLSGGASRTTWMVTGAGDRPTLFLQQERPGGVPGQSGQRAEIAAINAARTVGVTAPKVLASSLDADAPAELGEFVLVEALRGQADPLPLVSAEPFAGARSRFAGQIGELLARLHSVELTELTDLPTNDPLVFYRDLLDDLGEPHPALEVALCWLHENRPPIGKRPVLVHGDLRVGNLMYDADGLCGVLDWEITHVGDPSEDLGWLCVPSWRFGGTAQVGGISSLTDVLAAYHAAGGRSDVTATTVHWWMVFGTFKWAVICIMQAKSHLDGSERSVELAVLGRRTASVERDLLDLIDAPVSTPPAGAEEEMRGALHDAPQGPGLLDAVREHLAETVLPELEGRPAFLTKVSMRALGIVARELRQAPLLTERHRDRLSELGVTDDAALARAIRAGEVPYDHALAVVVDVVADKLLVSDPRRLTSEPGGGAPA